MSPKQQAIVDDFTARVEFFKKHAGYGYHPETESPEQGRERTAIELAQAEVWGTTQSYNVEWEHDHNPDYSGIGHRGPLWCCRVSVRCRCCGERTWEALCNIDLGKKAKDDDPYKRVVEAELLAELKARLTA